MALVALLIRSVCSSPYLGIFGDLGELTDPKKVRSSYIEMPDRGDKRQVKPTANLGPDYDNSDEGEPEPQRLTRGAMAKTVPDKPKGNTKGRKTGNRANNDGRRFKVRNDDTDLWDTITPDDDDQEMKERDERIKANTSDLQDAVGKCLVMFNFIFQTLPKEVLLSIQNNIQGRDDEDYVWLHTVVGEALRSETNYPGLMLANTNIDNPGVESAPAETATQSTGAAAVETTPTGTAAAAAAPTITNQSVAERQVSDRAREHLESINRKKNLIISGMVEDYDDWELIQNMLWSMGLAHLERDIVGNPSRLGRRRHDGRIRPLKIEFRNEKAVDMLLEAKYDLLNHDNYYRVYLNKDMTRDEREIEIANRKRRRSQNFPDSANGAGDRSGGGGNGGNAVNPSNTGSNPGGVNGVANVAAVTPTGVATPTPVPAGGNPGAVSQVPTMAASVTAAATVPAVAAAGAATGAGTSEVTMSATPVGDPSNSEEDTNNSSTGCPNRVLSRDETQIELGLKTPARGEGGGSQVC